MGEVSGGVMPTGITSVARAEAGPTLKQVLSVLNRSGIEVVAERREGDRSKVEEYIRQSVYPVFIMHHETPTTLPLESPTRRRLQQASASAANSNQSSASVSPLTEYEISMYQITLWTSVGLILLVAAAVSSLTNMEIIPDSLLFAKFQSTRTNKID